MAPVSVWAVPGPVARRWVVYLTAVPTNPMPPNTPCKVRIELFPFVVVMMFVVVVMFVVFVAFVVFVVFVMSPRLTRLTIY